jgi:hypothetical protein
VLEHGPTASTSVTPCGETASANHPTDTALKMAGYLLRNQPNPAHPAEPLPDARYVCIIDGGIRQVAGAAYDTHSSSSSPHVRILATNLVETLRSLAGAIKDPSVPDPANDWRKIDLDETMIIINTEFGRTPFRSSGDHPDPGSFGRDHWEHGYTNVFLGGPIAIGLRGWIADGTLMDGVNGMAQDFLSPTDVRAGALLAAGVDPFADNTYALGDLTQALGSVGSHAAGRANLFHEVLGVS